MVSASHVTGLPREDNVISLFPEREGRAAIRASHYGSIADDPFVSPATAPPSERWYEDELATVAAH